MTAKTIADTTPRTVNRRHEVGPLLFSFRVLLALQLPRPARLDSREVTRSVTNDPRDGSDAGLCGTLARFSDPCDQETVFSYHGVYRAQLKCVRAMARSGGVNWQSKPR